MSRAPPRRIVSLVPSLTELLFDLGEASIGPAGREQLARLATTLKEITAQIPAEIDWILRVDGHTDRLPIATLYYPSNWELSTARAVSVVNFLIEQGIPGSSADMMLLITLAPGGYTPPEAADPWKQYEEFK